MAISGPGARSRQDSYPLPGAGGRSAIFERAVAGPGAAPRRASRGLLQAHPEGGGGGTSPQLRLRHPALPAAARDQPRRGGGAGWPAAGPAQAPPGQEGRRPLRQAQGSRAAHGGQGHGQGGALGRGGEGLRELPGHQPGRRGGEPRAGERARGGRALLLGPGGLRVRDRARSAQSRGAQARGCDDGRDRRAAEGPGVLRAGPRGRPP